MTLKIDKARRDTRANFLALSHFGDQVVVESSISEWRRSSCEVRHKLFKGDVFGGGVLGNPRLGSALKDESRNDRGSAGSARRDCQVWATR